MNFRVLLDRIRNAKTYTEKMNEYLDDASDPALVSIDMDGFQWLEGSVWEGSVWEWRDPRPGAASRLEATSVALAMIIGGTPPCIALCSSRNAVL